MARPPATPAADDPGAERVTLTRAELDQLVGAAAARAVSALAEGRQVKPAHRNLPTEDEAEAQTEAVLADGIAPQPVETDKGWFVHGMVGATPEQVELHLAKIAAKHKRKQAALDESKD